MYYILFATQEPPAGHIDRIVFSCPGNAQTVMAYAQQLTGGNAVVPYKVSSLLKQPPSPKPVIFCRQMKTAQNTQLPANDPGFREQKVPSELTPTNPNDQTEFGVQQSALGDKYGTIPGELLGEFQ